MSGFAPPARVPPAATDKATLLDCEIAGIGRGTSAVPEPGPPVKFADFEGKACLVVNIATFCGLTVGGMNDMNNLVKRFGDKLAVVGVPCHQFMHQCPGKDQEILQTFKHVRPGGGYEPKFIVTTKVDVNGANADPVYKKLRAALPVPWDDDGTGILISTAGLISWGPVTRSDIMWNFEKCLVNRQGVPVRRYSPKYSFQDIAADIEDLVNGKELSDPRSAQAKQA